MLGSKSKAYMQHANKGNQYAPSLVKWINIHYGSPSSIHRYPNKI